MDSDKCCNIGHWNVWCQKYKYMLKNKAQICVLCSIRCVCD